MNNTYILRWWAIEFNRPNNRPKDIDILVYPNAFFDIELIGEMHDPYCNPEIIELNKFFSSNDGKPLSLKIGIIIDGNQ